MNINFHYYAVKALARCAGFNEGDAQLIAEYSQLIDDYSSKDTAIVDWATDTAIQSGLAIPDGVKFKVNLVTTGFITVTDSMALTSVDLQNRMLIPFHFIIPNPMTEANKDFVTIQAQIGDGQIISRLLEDVREHYTGIRNDLIKLGCLIHTFADTYAHEGFSGHRLDVNDYCLFRYEHRLNKNGEFVDETEQNTYVAPLVPYSSLPKIGHGTVGHAPDDTYCRYRFVHRTHPEAYPARERDNYIQFIEVTRRIYTFFCSITGEIPNFPLYQNVFENGFLANNYNTDDMVGHWTHAFINHPEIGDINFHYDRNEIMHRLFTAPPNMSPEDHQNMVEWMFDNEETREPLESVRTDVTPEFWTFTEFADHVRESVSHGFYNRQINNMKGEVKSMNWGSLIQTVLPTIGTVVGQLLGVKSIEEGVISYRFSKAGELEGATGEFTSTFFKDGDDYYVFNQSPHFDDQITIAFPSRENFGTESLTIPGTKTVKVTNLFAENAKADNCEFELTGCAAASQMDLSGSSPTIKISTSAKEIPVGDGEKHDLGSYLQVQVNADKVTIYSKISNIASLPLISIKGSGDSSFRVMDIGGQSGKQVDVYLPEPFMKGGMAAVEVVANIGSDSMMKMLEIQNEKYSLLTLEDDKVERIKNAPKLNWNI